MIFIFDALTIQRFSLHETFYKSFDFPVVVGSASSISPERD